ncbi:MAG: DNA-binding response regulator [Erythrobacter sp.]|nr:DNA-binding response regulator [Erythrobacter sp.]
MRTASTSVSLICSSSIVSEGLKSILLDEDFTIVGQHKSCQALITAGQSDAVETGMVVIDADAMQNVAKDVAAIREVFSASRIVILHEDLTLASLIEVFDAGADGYVLKETSCESLVNCLQLAARGEKVLPGELVKQLPHFARASVDQTKAEGELSDLLSERELATLRCLVMGHPNKVIARRLDIGEATVKVHVKAILRKLNVQNRTQAAICAVNHGVQATLPPPLQPVPVAATDCSDDLEEVCESNRAAPFMLANNRPPLHALSA